MRVGIKQKILLVLVGVLALTTALHAFLASYFTNRQNQESAFAALNRDLLAWQNDLQTLTLRLRRVALAAGGDLVLLNQLAELVTLELNIDDPLRQKEAAEMARALSYSKAVSLNRLNLVLRTGSFSSIAVYTGGKLSHYVSTSDAGMVVRRGDAEPVWIHADAETAGQGRFQSWPAWQEGQPPSTIARTVTETDRPAVSYVFPAPEFTAIDIVIPLEGVTEEFLRDAIVQPLSRIVSELTVVDPTRTGAKVASKRRPETYAVLVFRRLIDRAALQEMEAKTGKWPVLFSPDGRHEQRLNEQPRIPQELLQTVRQAAPAAPPHVIRQTVTTEEGSFYEALLPLQFEGRTRLILGLTSSRAPTLQNIRETVSALLAAAGLILVLSIVVGMVWMGRFIDPIVALTRAVKQVGLRRQEELEGQEGGQRITAEQLQPIVIDAPDEVGELSAAYNAMIAELRHAMETLEQRVQARTAELRQQTRYLRTLIDTLPLSVWLKDTEQRYLATNEANAAACCNSVEDMIGKTDEQLWPPETAQRFSAAEREVMRTQQGQTVEEQIAGPGGPVWMETLRAPVLDEDGTVLGIVGAAHNISARKAAEAAREQALAEAVRLARQRSEFLAQMSHELRTPLNAILGYAQILQRDVHQLTKRQAAGLATIQESGQHLLTLINDILDLARVEAGKLALYPTDIDLALFLRVVGDIIRVKAEEKSLLFSYTVSPDLPAAVKADDKRLRQVLLNLLGNAVKFTDHGDIALRVQRAAAGTAGADGEGSARLRFEVQDSGIGMSEEQLQRLFQPFEQVAEAPRREGGTGLGLAISQQLVRLMGGQIQVTSRPGQGSLFWFELELPVARSAMVPLPAARTIAGYAGPRRRVLIVDDVAQNRAMLMDTLQPLGFEVFDAGNGADCLEQLDKVRPDLIVMDVMMPVMDGREATRRIRQLPAHAGIPIVIVTASAGPEDEAKSYAAGANAFLPKPIEQDLLLKAIGEQLSLVWIEKEAVPGPGGEGGEREGRFVVPPADEIEKLYHIARLGDMQKIVAQADYLKGLDPRYAAFARELHALAANYQSKAIVALVTRYRAGQEEKPTENPPA